MNGTAFGVAREAIGEGTNNGKECRRPAAVAVGKLDGTRGAELTTAERRAITTNTALARWKKARET